MYDKSKKTWSQRLKITKTTESSNTTTATPTSTFTESSATVTGLQQSEHIATAAAITRQTITKTKTKITQDSAYNANLFGRHQVHVQQYQTVAATMHLPTLQLSDYHIGNGGGGGGVNGGYEYIPSSLSRSMKYAEPWIYGTVRGIPARPSYHHFMPQASSSPGNYMQPLAVVICSCPEYLNGTKRDVKKASVCKKCKGSRLPLTPIGGTMRLATGGMLATTKMRSSGAATVRVVSTTKKARPTILDPQKDPYDLMRRTRLLSPEPGSSNAGGGGRDAAGSTRDKDKLRGRGKSASPVRGRSRKRGQLPGSYQKQNVSCGGIREESDCWLVEDTDTLLNASGAISGEVNATRRSILRCNVNPYDLISHNQSSSSGTTTPTTPTRSKISTPTTGSGANSASQNEFMPPNDDFNVADAALTEEAPPFASNLVVGGSRMTAASNNQVAQTLRASKSKAENKTTVLRRESRTAGAPNTCVNLSEEDGSSSYDEEIRGKRNYHNVQAIAGQRISLGGKSTTKSLIKQSEDGHSYENLIVAEMSTSKQQSKRRIDEKQVKSHDSPTTPASAHPSRSSRLRKSESSESAESEAEHNRSKSEASKSSAIALDGDRVLLLTVTPNQNIKSILKRPTSSTSESGAESPIAKDQQPVLAASTSSIGAKASTPSNQRRTAAVTPSPTTKSQFYIPLPQTRKKVQFREEERIVHALECDMTSQDEVATEFAEMQELSFDKEDGKELDDASQQTLKATSNYEYYNRKREQQRLQRLENVSEIERTHPNGQAAQLSLTLPTQDALLAELQQYSDFVTQVIAQASNSYINSSNKSAENAVRDYDGYNFDETVIGMRAASSGSATNSMHYEDLSPITGGEGSDVPTTASSCTNNNKNSTSGSQQQSSDADERTVSFGGTKMLLTQQNAGRSAHSSPAIKATTIAATSSTSLPPTTKATNAQSLAAATVEAAAAVSHVIRSDKNDDYDDDANADDDDGDDGQLDAINKGSNNSDSNGGHESSDEDVYEDANDVANIADDKHYTVLGSSTVALTTAAASTGADDVLKAELGAEGTQNSATTKVAAREDADYAEVEDGEHSNSKKSANEVEQPQATQLRNPVRRSQSERHPRATTQPIMRTDNASCKNNNNITNNDYQLEDHTTNGDLRFAADICAGSSKASRARKYSNNTYKSNKTESHREEAILSFKDTMALRGKLHRNDSRDLFARPREPPPPPPTPTSSMASSCEADAAVTAAAQTTSTATTNDRAGNNKAATTAATKGGMPAVALMALETSTIAGEATQNCQANTSTLSLGPATSQQPSANKANNAAGAEKNSRVSKVSTNGLEVQQQRQEQEACAKTQTQLAFESRTDSAECGMQQMLKQNIRETKAQQQQQRQKQCVPNAWETKVRAITTPRGSSASITAKTSPHQRTVVRVAPFNKTKTTSEVHRLKISHTDNDDAYSAQPHLRVGQSQQSPTSPHYSFQYNGTNGSTFAGEAADLTMSTAQKKTSILINGDDCYSTMNLSCDDANTPLYQSSVVVADYSAKTITGDTTNDFALGSNYSGLRVTTSSNTVTINVSSARSVAEELIYQHNKINTMLSQQAKNGTGNIANAGRAIIPIKGSTEVNLQRSASSTSSTSTSSMTSLSSSGSGGGSSGSMPKRGRTLIRLDYEPENSTNPKQQQQQTELCSNIEICVKTPEDDVSNTDVAEPLSHEEELLKILRNPVEAVKRNLVPHICGRNETSSARDTVRNRKMKNVGKQVVAVKDTKATTNKASMMDDNPVEINAPKAMTSTITPNKTSFITKLLEDPMLSQVADGLETETVAELIENSLRRLQESRSTVDMTGTKDNDDMNRLINISLQKIKEERQHSGGSATSAANGPSNVNNTHLTIPTKDEDGMSNRGSISSANSFASANNYEMFDFDANESDCYQSCSSEITTPGDDDISSANTRSKFYQMLVDATLAEIEMSTNLEEDIGSHHYESIRNNADPIYEEINDVPPPLPLSAPPISDTDLEKKAARSIFEGASKYDILSYLVDAKERGVVREETFDYPLSCSNPIIIEEEAGDTLSELGKCQTMRDLSSRASVLSDSSEDAQSMMSSLSPPTNNFICGNGSHASLLQRNKGASSDIERNDSGVGSETSKSSRSKYQNPLPTVSAQLSKDCPIHLCEDCDGPVETQVSDSGIMFAPLVCRKCGKKRMERKEIITEIVETEEKYGRDLQIILEEFCHPMLVAGLLTQEQLSAIFLNTEELLENNQTLAERMRDALDIALEQGDDDLLTVNIGKIFLDFTQMLHAFESYCVRQAGASLLLANLEKEKELLRIFLKVSQMENAVLRRMNLNSFLMVPVQRVTKYPLLLARLYKVTPAHLEGRDQLKQAQEKIELHLNHINQEAKDVPTKLWRRISSSSPNRRASSEIDMINIKLRKMAIDILEWNHDEVRFAMEGKLLYTQPTDSNWKKARTIKLTPVNALLVTNGKPSANYKAEKVISDKLNFPKHTGIREASLLVVKEKCGRYTLIREPLYLDRCVVCSEADLDDYFEVQEISSKDTFIFKAEDGVRTKQWYTQLQFHAQGMGAWRKRRNALANIMINGMLARN